MFFYDQETLPENCKWSGPTCVSNLMRRFGIEYQDEKIPSIFSKMWDSEKRIAFKSLDARSLDYVFSKHPQLFRVWVDVELEETIAQKWYESLTQPFFFVRCMRKILSDYHFSPSQQSSVSTHFFGPTNNGNESFIEASSIINIQLSDEDTAIALVEWLTTHLSTFNDAFMEQLSKYRIVFHPVESQTVFKMSPFVQFNPETMERKHGSSA